MRIFVLLGLVLSLSAGPALAGERFVIRDERGITTGTIERDPLTDTYSIRDRSGRTRGTIEDAGGFRPGTGQAGLVGATPDTLAACGIPSV